MESSKVLARFRARLATRARYRFEAKAVTQSWLLVVAQGSAPICTTPAEGVVARSRSGGASPGFVR
jgi:hypothetical protein